MEPLKEPVAVMPPVYELPIRMWRWCKLQEVCAIVPKVAKLADNDFDPGDEELISLFAGLVRPNKLPEHCTEYIKESRRKKIFRYSLDGNSLWGTEVPQFEPPSTAPPYEFFKLEIPFPYPPGLFVPEGWVIDTLKAIRLGAIAAADFGDRRIGFPPKGKEGLISLEGKKDMIVVRLPDFLRS